MNICIHPKTKTFNCFSFAQHIARCCERHTKKLKKWFSYSKNLWLKLKILILTLNSNKSTKVWFQSKTTIGSWSRESSLRFLTCLITFVNKCNYHPSSLAEIWRPLLNGCIWSSNSIQCHNLAIRILCTVIIPSYFLFLN